jgi:DNA-binding response OmpR family regulator
MKRSERKDVTSGSLSINEGLLTVDPRSLEVRKKGVLVSLTPTEFKILSVLAGSPSRVFTRGELVESALGYQFEGYERSIDAHIKNIRQKIEDDPRAPSLIFTVYGVGYKFAGKIDDQKSLG